MTQNQFVPENILIPFFGKDAHLVGVEIGVMTACGSVAMLDRMPNLKLICIDPWKHVPGAPFEAGHDQPYHDTNYQHSCQRLAQYPGRVTILRMGSDEAAEEVPFGIDFVHIDGHHTENQVTQDILNYWPKIRHGGLISGHDYLQVPDVTWAIDKVFLKDRIHTGEDFTWWVYK